jgi:hypothetical protein
VDRPHLSWQTRTAVPRERMISCSVNHWLRDRRPLDELDTDWAPTVSAHCKALELLGFSSPPPNQRQCLQCTYVEDKFQLSHGRLHLCLNLHSVKLHQPRLTNQFVQPRNTIIISCGVGSSEPWSFDNTVVVREETVYSIC